jgi:hypothetical protein
MNVELARLENAGGETEDPASPVTAVFGAGYGQYAEA